MYLVNSLKLQFFGYSIVYFSIAMQKNTFLYFSLHLSQGKV